MKYLLLVITFLIQCQLTNKIRPPQIKISMQEMATNINQDLLKIFNLGQKRMIVSLMWIKTLIDSDLEHYQQKDLNSWMYHRFNAITDLSPWFIEAYRFGGQYLSIIKDDDKGASTIFIKGLAIYPDDQFLLQASGYHFLFEDTNETLATEIYRKLASIPRLPPHYKSTYARLLAKQGLTEEYHKIIQEIINGLPKDSPLLEHYKKKLNSL